MNEEEEGDDDDGIKDKKKLIIKYNEDPCEKDPSLCEP